jgi:hypothetical protein
VLWTLQTDLCLGSMLLLLVSHVYLTWFQEILEVKWAHWWAIGCHEPNQPAFYLLWQRIDWLLSLHNSLSYIALSFSRYHCFCELWISLLYLFLLKSTCILYSEIYRFLNLWVGKVDIIVHLGYMLYQSLILIVTHHSFYVLAVLKSLTILFCLISPRLLRCFV